MQIIDQDLFSQCGGSAPDWAAYTGLELGGCTVTDSGVAFNAARFFTVYGRRANDQIEPITNVTAASERERPILLMRAMDVAAELSYRSGLAVTLYRPNGSV